MRTDNGTGAGDNVRLVDKALSLLPADRGTNPAELRGDMMNLVRWKSPEEAKKILSRTYLVDFPQGW